MTFFLPGILGSGVRVRLAHPRGCGDHAAGHPGHGAHAAPRLTDPAHPGSRSVHTSLTYPTHLRSRSVHTPLTDTAHLGSRSVHIPLTDPTHQGSTSVHTTHLVL